MKYQVKANACFHAGIEYKIGDFLPEDLPIEVINHHLSNLSIVEEKEETPKISSLFQVKTDGKPLDLL